MMANELSIEELLAYKNDNVEILSSLSKYTVYKPMKLKTIYDKKPDSNWVLNKKLTEEELLYSNMKNLLNKISVSNLNDVVNEYRGLQITSEQQLSKLIESIIIKALSEHTFSFLYASLVKELATLSITIDSNKIMFQEILLKKCQAAFTEAISFDDENHISSNMMTNKNTPFKNKHSILGCVIFVGNLYNVGILSDKTIISTFKMLYVRLKKIYVIENMCTLMNTVGEKLFKSTDEAKICLIKFRELSEDTNLSVMDRCLLKNVIDKIKRHQ